MKTRTLTLISPFKIVMIFALSLATLWLLIHPAFSATAKERPRCGAGYCYDGSDTKNSAPVQQEPVGVSIYPEAQPQPQPLTQQQPQVSVTQPKVDDSRPCTYEEIDRDPYTCGKKLWDNQQRSQDLFNQLFPPIPCAYFTCTHGLR